MDAALPVQLKTVTDVTEKDVTISAEMALKQAEPTPVTTAM